MYASIGVFKRSDGVDGGVIMISEQVLTRETIIETNCMASDIAYDGNDLWNLPRVGRRFLYETFYI